MTSHDKRYLLSKVHRAPLNKDLPNSSTTTINSFFGSIDNTFCNVSTITPINRNKMFTRAERVSVIMNEITIAYTKKIMHRAKINTITTNFQKITSHKICGGLTAQKERSSMYVKSQKTNYPSYNAEY